MGAFALTRLLESLLFGVSPTDPVTFTAIVLLLSAVALLAQAPRDPHSKQSATPPRSLLRLGSAFSIDGAQPGTFVIPNAWDVGSARLLAGLGFGALATSSTASATAFGGRDDRLTRDEALAHARSIVDATDLPVSADLEKGFGDLPEVAAETIRLAASVGLVGCTIEDATGNQDSPPTMFTWLSNGSQQPHGRHAHSIFPLS